MSQLLFNKLLSSTAFLRPSEAQQNFVYAAASMSSLPRLKNAAQFIAGRVTFGKPTLHTSAERKLLIPDSITAASDVYWIEFAVSFRDLNTRNIERLAFGVTAPSGTVALELVPLRYDREMSTSQITSSPEIKLRVGEKAVELGKIFEQQVVFRTLRPIIVADGLQEHEFSWSLMEEAIQPGAKRFVAILAVPKGSQSLTVLFQATAITKPGFFAQGNVIATEPVLAEIRLR